MLPADVGIDRALTLQIAHVDASLSVTSPDWKSVGASGCAIPNRVAPRGFGRALALELPAGNSLILCLAWLLSLARILAHPWIPLGYHRNPERSETGYVMRTVAAYLFLPICLCPRQTKFENREHQRVNARTLLFARTGDVERD